MLQRGAETGRKHRRPPSVPMDAHLSGPRSAKGFWESETRLPLPCLPRKRHCGAHAHRASQDPPASGLLPGVFLRGGARVPATPEPPGPHSGLRGLVLLGHVRRRCGASGQERSRSRGGCVHRGAGPFPSPPKGAPTSSTCLSLPKAAGPLPAPRPPLAGPADCARQTFSYASARQTEINGCSWRPG